MEIFSNEHPQTGILPADRKGRRRQLLQEMPTVPTIHSTIPKQPLEEITSVLSPIPFAMWAVEIVGILPTSTRQAKYCIVAIDYMTKRVEARPLSAITEEAAKKFFLEQIILRFGIPMVCVSDNGTQFIGSKFRKFLVVFGIQQRFSSVGHPQGNGKIEAANKIIFEGIKKRLGGAKGFWVEELPWAYRTTPRSSTGETPSDWPSGPIL